MSRPLVRHAFDFDLAVDHHVALHRGAGWRVFAEITLVDGVEAPEIARVVEPDAAAHDMFEAVAGLFENGDEVLDGQMRLIDNAAIDDFAILHGHLAGDEEETTGFHGAGKGEILAAGTRLFGAITLDRHWNSPFAFSESQFRYEGQYRAEKLISPANWRHKCKFLT